MEIGDFIVLLLPLFFWGLWPILRVLCGAPMAAFATLNMLSQFLTACTYLLLLGSFSDAIDVLKSPNLREWAVFAGGFALGHADQLSALSMSYLPAAIAFPLYAGTCVVLAQLLNVIQTGSESPVLLGLGLALVALGLVLLTITQSLKEQHSIKTAGIELELPNYNPDIPDIQNLGGQNSQNKDISRPSLTASELTEKHISTNLALFICLTGGLLAGGWSPLSTYARAGGSSSEAVQDPYVCLFIFQLGQLCAIPTITNFGGYLTGTGVVKPIQALDIRAVFWGVMCGVFIASGYVTYFASSAVISPTVVFGIVTCCPLLTMVVDIIRGEFKGTSMNVKICLGLSITAYSSAIAVLVQLS